jgi:antitoxin FitA
MANLIVRDINESLVRALKHRTARHVRIAEAKHRAILASVLRRHRKRNLESLPMAYASEAGAVFPTAYASETAIWGRS